jgi:putative PEP-CTERM system histidine kinase
MGVLETARPVAWAFAVAALSTAGRPLASIGLATAALLAVRLALAVLPKQPSPLTLQAGALLELMAVAIVLVTIIGVFRAAGESERWGLKFLVFPLLVVFGYDLVIYTYALSLGSIDASFAAARILLTTIAVPPIVLGIVRLRVWRNPFRVSQQAAFYSTALIGIGLYFVGVAGAGLILRNWSGLLAPPLQISILLLAILILLFILASGRTRAQIKFFVKRHFFARKYDYQHEWRKLMHTLSEGNDSPLENRVIRACADLLEVPGGALWLFDDKGPRLQATWNYRPPTLGNEVSRTLFQRPDGRLTVLRGDDLRAISGLSELAGWIVIPLPQDTHVLGFLVLCHPRAEHDFDIEDEALILLAARQCASHLAEKQATVELEQNRQFARFNRQYAFVAHDIKNLMSQLSVMLKNFDQHADNPTFQHDMKDTVRNTVERMQQLVDRLNALREGRESMPDQTRTNVAEGTREAARQFEAGCGKVAVSISPSAENLEVAADSGRFVAIVGHLIANAFEAAGPEGDVSVRVDTQRDEVLVDVIDDGPGMSADFVRQRLFSPFRSNKQGGFGVGVYQCREFARERGGELDVVSSLGSGTTMRLRIPVAQADAHAPQMGGTQ